MNKAISITQLCLLLIAPLLLISLFPTSAIAYPSTLPSSVQSIVQIGDNGALAQAAEYELKLARANNGYQGGEKYWRSQDFHRKPSLQGKPENWCCDFVTYCAALTGLVKDGSWPTSRKHQCYAGDLETWLKAKGAIRYENDGTYIPRRGDLAITNNFSHIGIVTEAKKVGSSYMIVVVQGNKGNKVDSASYTKSKTGFEKWNHFVSVSMVNRLQVTPNLTFANVEKIPNQQYKASPATPELVVKIGGVKLACNKTYIKQYYNNKTPGTAKARILPGGIKTVSYDKLSKDKYINFSVIAKSVKRWCNTRTNAHVFSNGNWPAPWKYEGIAFKTAYQSSKPVYHLLSRTGERLFTTNVNEKNQLILKGTWYLQYTGFHSDPYNHRPVYRLYNSKRASLQKHHWTASTNERDALVQKGWRYEGIAWYVW